MHIQHTALATAATTASLVACTITKIQGMKVAANDRFLQLHDSKATPAAAAVPKRIWPIYGSAPFGEAFIVQPVALTYGATFVVSTTAETYTASAETVDITIDGNAVFDSTGVTTVGDYTTGAPNAEIWAAVAGTHRLLRLEMTALSDAGAVLYLKQYSTSNPTGGQQPIAQWVMARNTSRSFMFNTVALQPTSNLAACYFALDTTPGGYDGTYAGSDFAFKATYV